jgi:hypothetical protein
MPENWDVPESEFNEFLEPSYQNDGAGVWEPWFVKLEKIGSEMSQYQWAIGDTIVEGEELLAANPGTLRVVGKDEKHAVYQAAANRLGLTPAYVKNLAYVARKVSKEIRKPELTFSHHKLVAALPPEQQTQLLTEMATKARNVPEARKRVRYLLGQDRPKSEATERAEEIVQAAESLAKLLARPYAFKIYDVESGVNAALIETLTKTQQLIDSELESVGYSPKESSTES